MVGQTVRVHLKDERILSGILDSVGGDFGLTLGKCSGIFDEGPRRGEELPPVELVFIAGRVVRFVELPNGPVEDHLKRAWKRQNVVKSQQAGPMIGEAKRRKT